MVNSKFIRKGLLLIACFTVALIGTSLLLQNGPREKYASFREVRNSYTKSDALLFDRHGEIIHELRVDFKGRRLDWIPLKEISPALLETVLCSEDRRFYRHNGVDWRALSAAMITNVFTGNTRGASTITMQLVSLFNRELKPVSKRRTLYQKWKQIRAAGLIEKSWTKDEILEAYLNLASFRGELQGISAASRGLFGKEASGLNQIESLILASLIPSPNGSAEAVAKRAVHMASTINAGLKANEIAPVVMRSLSVPYRLRPRIALAPHVAASLLEPGKTGEICTLDAQLQRFVSQTAKNCLERLRLRNVRDCSVLVAENKTGQVLAYMANTGEESSARYVDGVLAPRQAGSTLKPFLYGIVFEKRILTPASLMDDSPLDFPTSRGLYSPGNYDNIFRGLIPARIALASSLNVPAVRVLSLIGEDVLVKKMGEIGMKNLRDGEYYGLSLALGSADVSLWGLVNAYRALANGGIWSELSLRFPNTKRSHQRVFSKEAAFIISDILSDREARSITFGLESPLSTNFWSAVKTGTSMDMRDNWCVGYSSMYTVGVWVGNFSGEPMWNVSGISGAAPIWLEIMTHLHKKAFSACPSLPDNIIKNDVLFPQTGNQTSECFIKGTETNIVRCLSSAYLNKISYPPSGTIIALDPDIPTENQKIFFEATQTDNNVRWVLNGTSLSFGSTHGWTPVKGFHRLLLVNGTNRIEDEVTFSIR